MKQNGAKQVDSVFDASFINAWSTRDPEDNQTGYSDHEARVGRTGRTFGLGYKLHLSIDSKMMLLLSSMFASANQNEKKHSLAVLFPACPTPLHRSIHPYINQFTKTGIFLKATHLQALWSLSLLRVKTRQK